MTLVELIDKAAQAKGSLGTLAQAMGKHQTRLSEWKKGDRKPDAHEIAYLANVAGLPVLSTVAEIEAQLDERYASVWREALGKLTAAGIAASLAAVVFGVSPDTANARPLPTSNKPSLYIM